jgi:hypothetical protein
MENFDIEQIEQLKKDFHGILEEIDEVKESIQLTMEALDLALRTGMSYMDAFGEVFEKLHPSPQLAKKSASAT